MQEFLEDRAADIAAKQAAIADLLRDAGRDGLLLLDPANFSWITAGAESRGIVDPEEYPAAFVQNASYRWIICSNVDSQRLFDEEVGGLGFQLKEWPWHWGRKLMLADLVSGKSIACDRQFADVPAVGEAVARLRRRLSLLEQRQMAMLGATLAHAVEATGRNFERGQTEEEIGGQLAHRLLHRGLEPVSLQVSADGRLRRYRRHGPGTVRAERSCVVQATARRFGLHATCSRVVSFGPPADSLRADMETACRWSAVTIAASMPGQLIAEAFVHGNHFLELQSLEHEWRLAPCGWITGRNPKEMNLPVMDRTQRFEDDWAVVWPAHVGTVTCADTILLDAAGPKLLTPVEQWPLKRIRVAGQAIDRPDILVREE